MIAGTLPLVLAARAFAFEAHAGHKRGNKAEQPYVYHLEEVARLVEISGGDLVEIASAWLHDVVEDTQITIQDIFANFNDEVGETVDGLTDPEDFLGLPLLERKTKQAARVQHESTRVKRVKLGDQTSNLWCIARDPPVDWGRSMYLDYIEGARLIACQCVGISSYLDEQFQGAYTEAMATHSR